MIRSNVYYSSIKEVQNRLRNKRPMRSMFTIFYTEGIAATQFVHYILARMSLEVYMHGCDNTPYEGPISVNKISRKLRVFGRKLEGIQSLFY